MLAWEEPLFGIVGKVSPLASCKVTISKPGFTVDVVWVLPVMLLSMLEGVGDSLSDAGVIVDVDEDRDVVMEGAVR